MLKYLAKRIAVSAAIPRRSRTISEMRVTGTRKALFLVMVSAHGLKANEYQAELVQNVVPLEALFAP